MKAENKKLLMRIKFGCLGVMAILLIIAITSLIVEGANPVASFLVIIALCCFLPVYLNIAKILRSE